MKTKKDITESKWDHEVVPGIGMILQTAQQPPFSIPLADAAGNEGTAPLFTRERIMFNGLGEDSYETMMIQRCKEEFYFCKTARMPYDGVCVAVLIFMETCFRTQFSWNSDGDHDDDHDSFKEEGLRILKATFDYEILDRKSLTKCIKESLKSEDPALQGSQTA